MSKRLRDVTMLAYATVVLDLLVAPALRSLVSAESDAAWRVFSLLTLLGIVLNVGMVILAVFVWRKR